MPLSETVGAPSPRGVARNYRAEMMAPGDPVVFWISGNERGIPVPGVWGIGQLTGGIADPIGLADDPSQSAAAS